MAGNSTTPLVRKLGITDLGVLAILSPPAGFALDLPLTVRVKHQARGAADVVLAFFTEVDVLSRRIERLGAMVYPSGGLWIAWPKGSSPLRSDLTDHAVRDVSLPLGLVDNKVCAIDDHWTALRMVWRLRHRSDGDRAH